MNNYKKIILKNGIPLYLYNNKSLKQTLVNYIVKYGSSGRWYDFILDGKDYHMIPGYAHYLEHLLGERSKHGNIYTNFSKYRHSFNAITEYDHTYYYFCGVNHIKESIKELIESIECPIFDKKDVDATRHAISEESSMWCDDTKLQAVSLVEKNLYGSYSEFDETLSCIGNRNTTSLINIDDLYNCYNAFYSDDNKILVIAGNVNEQELVDYLNEIYENIKPHQNKVILPNYDLEPLGNKEDIIYRNIGKEIDALGLKLKINNSNLTMADAVFGLDILIEYLLSDESNFLINAKKDNILDELHYVYYRFNRNYIHFITDYISENAKEYNDRLISEMNKKEISKRDFELMRKVLIAEEIRNLDNKYEAAKEFGMYMNYNEDYGRLDYLLNTDYNKFMEILNKLNFSTPVTVKVKKL